MYYLGAQGNSCDEYYVLNDPTRNSDYGYAEGYCDQVDYFLSESHDWRGPAWYRFSEIAGNTIPEEPIEGGWRCNSQISGWLFGHHPLTNGETIDGTVCFSAANGQNCYKYVSIKIKHCNDYFLYKLGDVPACNARYCSTNTNMTGMYLNRPK